jgi:hypothetical protein
VRDSCSADTYKLANIKNKKIVGYRIMGSLEQGIKFNFFMLDFNRKV